MNMPGFELIVFDLDGTIADSAPEIRHCLNRTLGRWGLSGYSLEEVKTFLGDGAKVLARKALTGRLGQLAAAGHATGDERSTAPLDAFHSDLLEVYVQSRNERTLIYDGVYEFLERAPMPLALFTNKPRVATERFLRQFKMEESFKVVLTPETAPALKPHPGGLSLIMEKLGVTRETTLMVGDGTPDIRVAKAAGVRSCAMLGGFTPEDDLLSLEPDWAFDTFKEFGRATGVLD